MSDTNKPASKLSLLSRWKNRDKKPVQATEITKIPDNIAIPLSNEQKRLWFLQQLNPDNPFYNYAELYRLEGNIDAKLFEKSIRFIEEKHDVLRANFLVDENGVPKVQIHPSAYFKFAYVDFSEESLETATTKATNLIDTKTSYAFNLASETLLQPTLIKVSEKNYLFLIVMHHIITDKWSMKVFRKEWVANYDQLTKGITPKITKPEIQYASYAHWQSKQAVNKTHLAYWKEKLSGEITPLKLTTDYPKKAQPTYKGTFDKQFYDNETADAFFELCKKMDATAYITMLSVYYVLLQKYSNQTDILIGTPITKREKTSLENLIGFFNDTLVLRTKIDTTTSFANLVKAVKKTTLDAFEHKDIYFDTLVKTLKPERSLSVHPFFQVMFLYHKVPETPKFNEDIKIAYEPYDSGVAKFDVTLYISEDKGALMSLMEYETDLFEAATIQRMHQHFSNILKTVIQNPEIIVDDIQLHNEEDMVFFNKIAPNFQEYENEYSGIHDLITAQAEKNPEAIALAFKDEKLTYKALNQKANIIAKTLIQQGIKTNNIVGLCIERSIHMIVAMLGILKSGAAYLPLDPEYPAERTAYILANANAKLLLTQQKLVHAHSPLKTLTLEAINTKELTEHIILPKVDKEDLAYVIYTSGSTGNPKGVPISHNNIINATLARTDYYHENPSAFLLMSSISFDSSKAGIFWSLCSGSTLVISEKHLEQNIELLTQRIAEHNVSHTLMLPSLYTQIITFGEVKKLTSLKSVIVAGEACATNLVANHFNTLPSVNLYNEYGPTESTVWCIAHKITKEDAQKSSVPIGIPIKNIQVFILNENLQRVPFGTEGELYIGGLGLAKGYLNDKEKTTQSFVEHPFAADKEQKLYKTGDLAKFNKAGYIEFLGRKDQQVKVRGYRIELDEIEQVITKNKQVAQVVVAVESQLDTINWQDLETTNTAEITKLIDTYLVNKEAEDALNFVEKLPQEALDTFIENLE